MEFTSGAVGLGAAAGAGAAGLGAAAGAGAGAGAAAAVGGLGAGGFAEGIPAAGASVLWPPNIGLGAGFDSEPSRCVGLGGCSWWWGYSSSRSEYDT